LLPTYGVWSPRSSGWALLVPVRVAAFDDTVYYGSPPKR
jgi:hypothetical protein